MLASLSLPVQIYIVVITALLGLVMGSALNCLSYRIAKGEKWSGGRSPCASCGHELKVFDLIPLFSYIFLRGKCRYCGKRISSRYVIAEVSLAVIYVSLLWRFDLSLETLFLAVLCSCLFCLTLVDLDIQIIPDRFLSIAAVSRLVYLVITHGFTVSCLSAVWYSIWHGLVLGGVILILSLVMDKVLHKESMGGGDIKLLAVLGLYFDLPCCFFLLIAACVIGLILALGLGAKKGIAFPFGPALSIAAWVTLLAGAPVTAWYMGLF